MSKTAKGTVYLVGAGPGDPELITIKGKNILKSCDAVIYDSLVPEELIVTLTESVELHYVGKKPGRHSFSQDKINRLLLELANKGKNVARLKGGDPFVFGRGAEEAKFLKENSIEFEIVSGVTSGVAAPASGFIPCTDRERASFIVIATGHKAIEKKLSSVPWDWIAGARKGTIVIYMGVGELKQIVNELMKNGMSPDVPSAIIERGTMPSQRVITSSLKSLPGKAESENINSPAIIVIGDVVDLRPYLQWSRQKSLLGIRVMVTRPADQAQETYDTFRELGAEVLPYPTISTAKYEDHEAWNKFQNIPGNRKWLIFTSENGVRYFVRQFIERFNDIRGLSDFKIAAIGKGTENYLKRFNLTADFIPSKATINALIQEIKELPDISLLSFVRLRGNLADDSVEKSLRESGAKVLSLTVYQTNYRKWPDGLKEKLFDHPPQIIIFTSGSTVDGLFANLSEEEAKKLASGAALASIGQSTTRVINSRELEVKIEAKVHTLDGLVNSIEEYFKARAGD